MATQLFHTDEVSIDAVVQQVGELLTRSQTLFAGPAASTPADSGARLADADQPLHRGWDRTAQLAGRAAGGHAQFVEAAGSGLSTLADSDEQLGRRLEHAAALHQRGRAASAAVLDAAAADTTALAPLARTPAGQRALLSALRTRVAQQQHLIADARAGAMAAAAAVRSLTYARREIGTST